MKRFLISAGILLGWIIFNADLVRSQSGNMSDITMPNPGEINNQPPESGGVNNSRDNGEPAEIINNSESDAESQRSSEPFFIRNEEINPTIESQEPINSNQELNSENNLEIVGETSSTETIEQQETINSNQELNENNPEIVDETASTETIEQQEPDTNSEVVEETETEAETETSENETEEVAKESDIEQSIDTQAYELQLQQSNINLALLMQEESYATQIASYSKIQIYGEAPSVKEISQRLGDLWEQTGKKAAFVNVSLQKKQIESFTVLPSVPSSLASTNISKNQLVQPEEIALRHTNKNIQRKTLLATAKEFRQETSNSRKIRQDDYLESAQQLYNLIIAPIEPELEANKIDIIVFAMDSGLRLLPLAALHDGEQFLIEKYAVATVPSFGLTDTRYVNLSQSSILAMGASKFKGESASLPTMALELKKVTHNASRGEIYLNEDFTVANFKAQNRRSQPFPIIHLGTHAEFNSGKFDDSYIRFYDEKLNLSALRKISDELGWSTNPNPPVELLVLSACETALGDEEAELGFAGLALQTGVKSALASLWYVSDLGTLALMGEFYDRLDDTLIKAEALRQTQLRMLTGQVRVEDRKIKLSNSEYLALPANFPQGSFTFSHPYFWSSFTLIGNWN